jgi:hypothetical protein
MGHTIKNLAKKELTTKAVFDRRFVIELAEKVHVHYRNLRLNLSMQDFLEICRGCIQAYERWNKRGQPLPEKGVHIELCRKIVATDAHNDGIQVNLNHNLYNENEGKVYAEGADFKDENYIHLKIRDMRLEMSIEEFRELVEVVKNAERHL